MAASCFCASRKAARGEFVKLVFPGGHVELLDAPVLAAEVMARHPRFCVARPDVFRDPAGAVAAPDAVLAPGHKYYVVPKSTVRRLQKYSPSYHADGGGTRRSGVSGGGGGGGGVSLRKHLASSGGHESCKSWLRCLVSGHDDNHETQRPRKQCVGGHGGKKDEVVVGDVEVKVIKENGKVRKDQGSPGRRRRRLASPGSSASFSWQPSLHSITEE